MNLNQQILSDVIVHDKYARWLPEENRRETFYEIVERNKSHHIKHYPELEAEIHEAYEAVMLRQVLPSMRSMQFAGKPMELSPNRCFNCVFLPINDYRAFSEIMFLLLGGSGVGYSIQNQDVDKLPAIRKPTESYRYLVGDSIEGWSDSILVLAKAYLANGRDPRFDFRDVRKKNSILITSGGRAPGPEPLEECLNFIRAIFESKANGEKLTPLEVHDIACYIADAVLSGGIRRSAMIALFSFDNQEMLTCKSGDWFNTNPQRGRANNSAVALRSRITEEAFYEFWKFVRANNSGEPGLFLTHNTSWGLNPCAEASLRAFQGCNLAEINASLISTQAELNAAARAAAFIGTLQASYTDFHYLRPQWKKQFEKDALLGVGITGLANHDVMGLDFEEAANIVKEENARVAAMIGINPAARCTLIKPSGTTSLLLGTSSGIHAWHSKFFLRRIKVLKSSALYQYLLQRIPDLLEDDIEKPDKQSQLVVPLAAPKNAITLDEETPLALLERVKDVYQRWVIPGHRSGDNTHAISCTVTLRDDEWESTVDWMWENRDSYNCLSVFPYYGGTHPQLPYEACNEEVYNHYSQFLQEIDLTEVTETEDSTDLTGEIACAGGACELNL